MPCAKRNSDAIALDWSEVHYTNCPLVSASNVDQELGWTREEFKKIGLTKSLNTIKNDWWRIQEHQGIGLMLRINGMTMDDVEIVEFPYPDDWYERPDMLDPMENPSQLWLKRDHKRDLAFRPLEKALEDGLVAGPTTTSMRRRQFLTSKPSTRMSRIPIRASSMSTWCQSCRPKT